MDDICYCSTGQPLKMPSSFCYFEFIEVIFYERSRYLINSWPYLGRAGNILFLQNLEKDSML